MQDRNDILSGFADQLNKQAALSISDQQFAELTSFAGSEFADLFLAKLLPKKRLAFIQLLGYKRFMAINHHRPDEILQVLEHLPGSDKIKFLKFLLKFSTNDIIPDLVLKTADPQVDIPAFLKQLPRKDRLKLLSLYPGDKLEFYLLGNTVKNIVAILPLLFHKDRVACLKLFCKVGRTTFFQGFKPVDVTKEILAIFGLLTSDDVLALMNSALDGTPTVSFIKKDILKNFVSDMECFKLILAAYYPNNKKIIELLLKAFPTEIKKLINDACKDQPELIKDLLAVVAYEKWPDIISDVKQFKLIKLTLSANETNVLVAQHIKNLLKQYKNYLEKKYSQLHPDLNIPPKRIERLEKQQEKLEHFINLLTFKPDDDVTACTAKLRQFKKEYEQKETKVLFKDRHNVFVRIFQAIANWLSAGRHEHKIIPAKTRVTKSVKNMMVTPITMFKAKKQKFIVAKAKTKTPTSKK